MLPEWVTRWSEMLELGDNLALEDAPSISLKCTLLRRRTTDPPSRGTQTELIKPSIVSSCSTPRERALPTYCQLTLLYPCPPLRLLPFPKVVRFCLHTGPSWSLAQIAHTASNSSRHTWILYNSAHGKAGKDRRADYTSMDTGRRSWIPTTKQECYLSQGGISKCLEQGLALQYCPV